MKLSFVDMNAEVVVALTQAFPEFTAYLGTLDMVLDDITDLDAVVSPANSFGIMDGGFDHALTVRFGRELPARVQRRIAAEYLGEQPVGTALVVRTGSYPEFLIHAPTMRYPMSIRGTLNVYDAMRAILLAAREYNETTSTNETQIEHILMSGLGTSAGQMEPDEAARLMRLAYDNMYKTVAQPVSWGGVRDRLQELT